MKVAFVLLLAAVCFGCGSSSKNSTTPPPSGMEMSAKPWQIDLWETSGALGHLSASLSSGTCGTVVGPACFHGSAMTIMNPDPAGTPTSLTVGTTANPVPSGSSQAFKFLLVEDVSGATWNIAGSGSFFPNGNIAGTWACDTAPSSPCAGLTGTFTAAQQ